MQRSALQQRTCRSGVIAGNPGKEAGNAAQGCCEQYESMHPLQGSSASQPSVVTAMQRTEQRWLGFVHPQASKLFICFQQSLIAAVLAVQIRHNIRYSCRFAAIDISLEQLRCAGCPTGAQLAA